MVARTRTSVTPDGEQSPSAAVSGEAIVSRRTAAPAAMLRATAAAAAASIRAAKRAGLTDPSATTSAVAAARTISADAAFAAAARGDENAIDEFVAALAHVGSTPAAIAGEAGSRAPADAAVATTAVTTGRTRRFAADVHR
jgi:hypothetical protein